MIIIQIKKIYQLFASINGKKVQFLFPRHSAELITSHIVDWWPSRSKSHDNCCRPITIASFAVSQSATCSNDKRHWLLFLAADCSAICRSSE